MIKKTFDSEEKANGAMFTIKNNFIGDYSIGVNGKTMTINGMSQEVYDQFTKNDSWNYIEVFGLFDATKKLLSKAELDFDTSSNRDQLIIDTRDSIQEILNKIQP